MLDLHWQQWGLRIEAIKPTLKRNKHYENTNHRGCDIPTNHMDLGSTKHNRGAVIWTLSYMLLMSLLCCCPFWLGCWCALVGFSVLIFILSKGELWQLYHLLKDCIN